MNDPSRSTAGLRAEWHFEERDLQAAARALPGSSLALLRWPIAFFIAYTGVGLADARVEPSFIFASALVITGAWIVMSLGLRGSQIRKASRVPEAERVVRLSIAGDVVRHETASGHASEFPQSDVTHARTCAAGLLVNVRGNAFLVPARAMQGNEEAWRAFASSVSPRPWPRGLGFTIGLWLFAALVAGYALTQRP